MWKIAVGFTNALHTIFTDIRHNATVAVVRSVKSILSVAG